MTFSSYLELNGCALLHKLICEGNNGALLVLKWQEPNASAYLSLCSI